MLVLQAIVTCRPAGSAVAVWADMTGALHLPSACPLASNNRKNRQLSLIGRTHFLEAEGTAKIT